jgi:tetratricopeptide (TPR) repeat protein
MSKPWKQLCLLALCLRVCTACASDQTVSFQTEGRGHVSVVDWDNLQGEGQALGDTPLTVKLDDLNGKVVRIGQDKKLPEYWVVSCDGRREHLNAKLRLVDAPQQNDCSAQIAAAKQEWKDSLPKDKDKDKDKDEDKKKENAAPTVPSVPLAALNKSHRLLLKAYEALMSNDLALARDLADKLANEVPDLASPFIIIGLSYLQAGDRQNARIAFSKASNLDPEDPSTRELMQLTQF